MCRIDREKAQNESVERKIGDQRNNVVALRHHDNAHLIKLLLRDFLDTHVYIILVFVCFVFPHFLLRVDLRSLLKT